MKGYFPVDYQSEQYGIDCRFLFKPIGKPSAPELADALRDSLRKVTYPDLILIVALPSEISQLEKLCSNELRIKSALERASNKVTIGIAEITKSGDFGNIVILKNERQNVDSFLVEKEKIYQSGLRQLLDDCNVFVPSPPGFIFLKPSGDRSTYFLRAEEAISSTERVHFLACCLLQRICDTRIGERTIELIFVDTMAIASVAYVLRDLYTELLGIAFRPSVESFHSYEGMKKVARPFLGKSLCIISASSSMNMQRDWVNFTSCGNDEVITLITMEGADGAEHAIYRHKLPNTHTKPHPDSSGGLRDLRILGENFSPEEISPKEVLLREKHHKLQEFAKWAPIYSKNQIISSYKRYEGESKIRAIHIDGNKLIELDRTKSFSQRIINQHLPVSIKTIIFQPDESSEKLARYCGELIAKHIETQPTVTSADNVSGLELKYEQGILIVAAVVGRGTRLLSLSRDLREKHRGPRQYLIGFHLGESWKDSDKLSKNLKFSREGYNYQVYTMEFLATGVTLEKSFSKEVAVLDSTTIRPFFTSEIAKPSNEPNQGSSGFNGSFLPPMTDGDKRLELRPAFAFWDDNPCSKIDHSACVLATIAAILQKARELGVNSLEEARLSSDAFQQVILDPDNFARFNDGIIQAALLRAAREPELDYSSNVDASYRMKTILKGILSALGKNQGEAALEFGLALATGKLKLTDAHKKELEQILKPLSVQNGAKIKLLHALVAKPKKSSTEDLLPF